MSAFFHALLDDLKTLLATRLGWLLTGIFGAQTDIPTVVSNVRNFFGF